MNELTKYSDIEAMNADIREWGNKVLNALRASAKNISGIDKHEFLKALRKAKSDDIKQINELMLSIAGGLHVNFYRQKKTDNSIYRVGFGFPSHGIFISQGIYGKEKGMKRNEEGNPSKKNIKRKINWFNPVVEHYIDQLADIIVKHDHNAVLNALNIFIPSVEEMELRRIARQQKYENLNL